ncbi:MAG TPA: gephyrin-like molybdotransferase Glp [Solirubrobacteraceae bacterium]|nr:gephyrin-like molybdotransferase Glp [Solirubrobacteraceae bacterium]
MSAEIPVPVAGSADRGSPPGELIELAAARALVLDHATALAAEDVALESALGRILAAAVSSSESVPGFDNSALDGFALRAGDTALAGALAPVLMRIVDESRAGHPARLAVGRGEAVAISTGAKLPEGADAVVGIEHARDLGEAIEVAAPLRRGESVRCVGEDVRAGEVVLPAGGAVGAFELGVLASIGCATVSCVARPRLRVLTTGDELLTVGEPPRPGAVRDANAYTVPALARLAGGRVEAVGRVPDDDAATRAAVAEALACDVAVICGGVSVGAHDHVRPALAAAGVQERFWGVALRPGKPTWFGTIADGAERRETLVFGLPGNPVSAVVTFLLLVRPAIRALCGADPHHDSLDAVFDEDYRKQPGRAHAVRCRLEVRDDGWHARSTGAQGSHVLSSMLGAEGLAIVPAASEGVAAGDRVAVELLPRAF